MGRRLGLREHEINIQAMKCLLEIIHVLSGAHQIAVNQDGHAIEPEVTATSNSDVFWIEAI